MCRASLGDVFNFEHVLKHKDSSVQGQGKNPVIFVPLPTIPSKDSVTVADAVF